MLKSFLNFETSTRKWMNNDQKNYLLQFSYSIFVFGFFQCFDLHDSSLDVATSTLEEFYIPVHLPVFHFFLLSIKQRPTPSHSLVLMGNLKSMNK